MRWVILAGCLWGCGSARRGLTVAAAPALDDEQRRGEVVFMRNCHSCHPFGEGGLGPPLNNRPVPRFVVRAQVRLGLGEMPSFDGEVIPPDDLRALSTYLVEVRRNRPE